MTDSFRWANEGLAFLLELAALGALCYWGFTTGRSWPVRIGLGVGAPLFAAAKRSLAIAYGIVALINTIIVTIIRDSNVG